MNLTDYLQPLESEQCERLLEQHPDRHDWTIYTEIKITYSLALDCGLPLPLDFLKPDMLMIRSYYRNGQLEKRFLIVKGTRTEEYEEIISLL